MYGEYNGRGPFPVMFAKPEATAFVHAILATATNCAPSCDVFQHLLIATPLLQVTPGWWAAPLTPGGRCCGGEAPEVHVALLGGPGLLGALAGCCDFTRRPSAFCDSALCSSQRQPAII